MSASKLLTTTAVLAAFPDISRDAMTNAYRRGIVAKSLFPDVGGSTRHMRPRHILALVVGLELWKAGNEPAVVAKVVEAAINQLDKPDAALLVVLNTGHFVVYTKDEEPSPRDIRANTGAKRGSFVFIDEINARIQRAMKAEVSVVDARNAKGAA